MSQAMATVKDNWRFVPLVARMMEIDSEQDAIDDYDPSSWSETKRNEPFYFMDMVLFTRGGLAWWVFDSTEFIKYEQTYRTDQPSHLQNADFFIHS